MRTFIAWLGLALSFVLYRMPSFGRRGIGNFLAFLWFDLFRIRRQVVLDNLAIAFPDMPLKERIRVGRKSLQCLGLNVVEYCFLPYLSKENFDKHYIFEGKDLLASTLARGKGVIMITCHIGHGDLACVGIALSGFPLTMVSKFFKWKWLNDAWFGMRRNHGMKFIPPRDSSFALLRALKSGEFVVLPLDQFTGPPIGVESKFFGKTTGTAAGPVIMAQRSGAPMLIGFTHRAPDGRHVIKIHREVPIDPTRDQATIERNVQLLNDQIEEYVRAYPEQWMWIHKRWKTFEVR